MKEKLLLVRIKKKLPFQVPVFLRQMLLVPPALDRDYGNDIEEEIVEEEIVRAAIEASKREAEEGYPNQPFDIASESSTPGIQQRQPRLEDTELAHAVSLSLKTAEEEKARHEQGALVGAPLKHDFSPSDIGELGKLPSPNERIWFFGQGTSSQFKLEAGSSSVQDETAEDVEEQPLVRHRSRHVTFGSMESSKDIGEMMDSPPSSPR
ncbi:hypothetical protein NE237_032811 [Protea cynaroides]|uniref:Uncharacterized protein n=1 Tax=Protea cynaroides TaxID=273540 RepID=A0A9Q0R3R4_9MAGN|nr:hypothetical protein NE237_032811 [Protea cynaroides]